jgi:hypothetical protein
MVRRAGGWCIGGFSSRFWFGSIIQGRGEERGREERRGEETRGEARRGEERRREERRGEARRGDARRGDARRREETRGDARRRWPITSALSPQTADDITKEWGATLQQEGDYHRSFAHSLVSPLLASPML